MISTQAEEHSQKKSFLLRTTTSWGQHFIQCKNESGALYIQKFTNKSTLAFHIVLPCSNNVGSSVKSLVDGSFRSTKHSSSMKSCSKLSITECIEILDFSSLINASILSYFPKYIKMKFCSSSWLNKKFQEKQKKKENLVTIIVETLLRF